MSALELREYCTDYLLNHIEFENDKSKRYVRQELDLMLNEDFKDFSNFAAYKNKVDIYFSAGDAVPKGYGMQVVPIKL